LEGYGSPPRGHNGTIDSHGRLTFSAGDPKQLVREQLPDLLRLSTDCPFGDVRERCAGILLDLEVRIPYADSDLLQLKSDVQCVENITGVLGIQFVHCVISVLTFLCTEVLEPF